MNIFLSDTSTIVVFEIFCPAFSAVISPSNVLTREQRDLIPEVNSVYYWSGGGLMCVCVSVCVSV